MTPQQRKVGFGKIPEFLTETVGGLTTGNKRKIERGKPNGLSAGVMTQQQRATLMKLVRVHIGRIRKDLADFAAERENSFDRNDALTHEAVWD